MASRVLQQKEPDLGKVRDQNRPVKIEIEQAQIDALIDWIREECRAKELRDELVERVRALRQVPINRVYKRFVKMASDLAEQLNKNLNEVVLEGGSNTLDPSVFDKVCTALVHLVREVSDDGAGIDPDRLVSRAREKGLVEERCVLSREEALELIFLPGFSTSQTVSDISGRGVGMDVVKSVMTELGGTVHIFTEVGRGTTFQLLVPREQMVVEARRDGEQQDDQHRGVGSKMPWPKG